MFKKILFVLFSLMLISSCFEKEVFPNEPTIAFEDINFDESEEAFNLSISFEDGDANIGIDEINDLLPPYHFASLIFDADTMLVSDTSEFNPPYIAAPISFLPRDIILRNGSSGQPRIIEVFEFQRVGSYFSIGDSDPTIGASICEDYQSFQFFFAQEYAPGFDSLSSVSVDALIDPNENYYNAFVEFYEQLPNGSVVLVDFNEELPGCANTVNLNGRIPFFAENAEKGEITWAITSRLFRIILGQNPIQLKFSIQDRELNRSNTDSTGFFFLEDVTF
ncbi:MAG: hypothetical protein HRT61_18190 [Ekhidna sp.]|nr:hypothetical protein [Ekhidna sp.]